MNDNIRNCTLRYALERHTGAVNDVINLLEDEWDSFSPKFKKDVLEEIKTRWELDTAYGLIDKEWIQFYYKYKN